MTPNEYRQKHKRCATCEYVDCNLCKVKKTYIPKTKGIFCRVYKAKEFKELDDLIADIRAEAYIEFAERLKEKAFNVTTWTAVEPAVTLDVIDNLLKEMVGEADV